MEIAIPDSVGMICRVLSDSGERAWVVGGSIRDLLRGRRPSDWDIATTARPDLVMRLFDRVVPTGAAHGTVTVLVGREGLEVTTLRGEGAYSDGRRPDGVTFLDDIEEDLARRDFTVNAMAWDPSSGRLSDPFGGRTDLEARLIRAVGRPAERFAEDGLRVLRAARFAATLEFELDPDTLDAMPAAAPALAEVSAERKRDEIVKTLAARAPSRGLDAMARSGLLPFACPGLERVSRNDARWRRLLDRVDRSPASTPARLASLLSDLGRGSSDSSDLASQWMIAMRFDRATRERVRRAISFGGIGYSPSWDDARVRRFVHRVGREDAVEVAEIERARLAAEGDPSAEHIDGLLARIEGALTSGAPLETRDLAVNGRTLMEALGIPPGPRIGEILDALLDLALDRPEDNTEERLLDLARDLGR